MPILKTNPANDTDVSTKILGMMGDKGKRIIEAIGPDELLLNTDIGVLRRKHQLTELQAEKLQILRDFAARIETIH